MRSDAGQRGGTRGRKPIASIDSQLIDTSQMARVGSAIFIRSQQVRDRQSTDALVGFQGRGVADVVQPNCCHPFLLEALLFQWPSIRRCASRTMVEHKTLQSNKSEQQLDIVGKGWSDHSGSSWKAWWLFARRNPLLPAMSMHLCTPLMYFCCWPNDFRVRRTLLVWPAWLAQFEIPRPDR